MRLLFVDPFGFAFSREFVLNNGFAIFFRAGLQIAVPNFAKPAAFLTCAMGRVEREQTRIELLERPAATGTTHLRTHDRESIFCVEEMGRATPDLEPALREIARLQDSLRV